MNRLWRIVYRLLYSIDEKYYKEKFHDSGILIDELERALSREVMTNIDLSGKLDEVHSWAVCGAITTPADMMGNLPRIVEITQR